MKKKASATRRCRYGWGHQNDGQPLFAQSRASFRRIAGKIALALDELGYIPNRAPDILSNATSHAIGVLLPSLTNQVFAEVLRGIESVTDAHGYQTMLAHYGYQKEREEQRLTSLLSYNIDGLILSERHHTARTLKMIEVAGIPVIELMDCSSPCIDLAVGFNNFEAARQMTQQIIAKGHRFVVYFGARQDERTVIKQQGYEQAMRESGLEPMSVMTSRSSSYSAGAELLREAQVNYPQIDSIFAPMTIWLLARYLNASARDFLFRMIWR